VRDCSKCTNPIRQYLAPMSGSRTPGQETGTYTVYRDCTGSMVINFNVPNVPPGTSSGVVNILFVISDGGRHIHEVVSEFTPPRSSGAVPTQISADDWKVASEGQDD
jgi:hypothetical protein